jgi:hypothetical protein
MRVTFLAGLTGIEHHRLPRGRDDHDAVAEIGVDEVDIQGLGGEKRPARQKSQDKAARMVS